MNAVQTFWATPGLSADQIHGGWLDPRYHFMSWSLSACLLHQHFDKTVLHTDRTGQHILVDLLGLPYDEIHLTQEGLGAVYPRHWWVLRKIQSYAQPEPFLHVDGDAFLWNGLPANLEHAGIIAQNEQRGFGCYGMATQQLIRAGVSLPAFLDTCTDFEAVNMGVVGGTDVAFFRDYVAEVRSFYDAQLAGLAQLPETGFLNTLIEECFFQQYAIHQQKQVRCLIDQKLEQTYKSLGNPLDELRGLTHLIGVNKTDLFYCQQVERALKRRFPAVYERIVKLVANQWQHKATFSLAGYKSFPESNVIAQEIDPALTVDAATYETLLDAHGHESRLGQIIGFERDKYALFADLIAQRAERCEEQQQWTATLDKLLDTPIDERLDDQLCFAESVPLMRFQYPGQAALYLATLYDFTLDYTHIAHRPLDDLSIFILYASENPVTLATLLEQIIDKSGAAETARRARLIQRVDLRIKELVYVGLLDYQTATVTKNCLVDR